MGVVDNDQKACLASLKPFDCETVCDNYYIKQHENTCNWFFADQRYRKYIGCSDCYPILWIHGNPGCGKSVLSSVLTRKLTSGSENIIFGGDYSVVYFFCDDKDEQLRTASAILLNLLSQLLRQDPGVLVHFLAEPDYAVNTSKTVWNFGMLWRVFERIVRDENVRPMCIVIDALGK